MLVTYSSVSLSLSCFPGQEVVPGLRALLAPGLVPVVVLRPAPPGVPVAPRRPTTAPGPAAPPPPAATHHRLPSRRSPPSAPPRRANRPPRPPRRPLREPPSPARAPVHAPALAHLPPTASAKELMCKFNGNRTVETTCFSSRISLEELARRSSHESL